jgi:small subunit ribosomal protein S27Ae
MAAEGKKSYSRISLYTVEGQKVTRSRRTCPKCGPGVFLAQHKNRESCGRCGHTDFKQKPAGDEAKGAGASKD